MLTGWQLVSKETFITLVIITDGMKQVLVKNNTISNNAIEEILRMFTISWIHMNFSLRSTASQKKRKTWKTVFYDPVISNPPWGISFHHDHNSLLIQRGFFFFLLPYLWVLPKRKKKKTLKLLISPRRPSVSYDFEIYLISDVNPSEKLLGRIMDRKDWDMLLKMGEKRKETHYR